MQLDPILLQLAHTTLEAFNSSFNLPGASFSGKFLLNKKNKLELHASIRGHSAATFVYTGERNLGRVRKVNRDRVFFEECDNLARQWGEFILNHSKAKQDDQGRDEAGEQEDLSPRRSTPPHGGILRTDGTQDSLPGGRDWDDMVHA